MSHDRLSALSSRPDRPLIPMVVGDGASVAAGRVDPTVAIAALPEDQQADAIRALAIRTVADTPSLVLEHRDTAAAIRGGAQKVNHISPAAGISDRLSTEIAVFREGGFRDTDAYRTRISLWRKAGDAAIRFIAYPAALVSQHEGWITGARAAKAETAQRVAKLILAGSPDGDVNRGQR